KGRGFKSRPRNQLSQKPTNSFVGFLCTAMHQVNPATNDQRAPPHAPRSSTVHMSTKPRLDPLAQAPASYWTKAATPRNYVSTQSGDIRCPSASGSEAGRFST